MKISFSATNPCHMHPLAAAVASAGAAGIYYSGYPASKLPRSSLKVRGTSWRTLIAYGALRLPPGLRPSDHRFYKWQDRAFDKWVGRHLKPCDSLHALPGQCLATFRSARSRDIRTVLNHAMGPVKTWLEIMQPEYDRAKLNIFDHCPFDAEYVVRSEEETELADGHCVASSIVRDQLEAEGVPAKKIWVVPYPADKRVFYPGDHWSDDPFRIVFAGQLALRKGIRFLLEALQIVHHIDWLIDFCGPSLAETSAIGFERFRPRPKLRLRGALSITKLAQIFRESSVLVLPSIEEGFGLVVPQALCCGLPCIVSDRVGAKDIIEHRVNGSIFPAGDSYALATEIEWWSAHRRRVKYTYSWHDAADQLIKLSEQTGFS